MGANAEEKPQEDGKEKELEEVEEEEEEEANGVVAILKQNVIAYCENTSIHGFMYLPGKEVQESN